MERCWDSSEPSGRSRGKVVRKTGESGFFGKRRNLASGKLVRKGAD